MCAIHVKNLKKYFGETRAVDGISFEIKEGEIFGYLGPNGAGKTTTIRCMMDFLRPDEGMIEILGLDAQAQSAKLKQEIGFLSEEDNLYQDWTGQEHINLIKRIRGGKTRESELITKLDFDPNKKVKTLSSGNKQKLGLILALMHQPKVLILDEPTKGLDPLLQHTVHEILQTEVKERNTSIFMSSHNLSEVEKTCDRVCVLKAGKVVAIESISDIKKKKLYTIYIYFDGEVPERKKLAALDVEIIKELSNGLVLSVRGEIKPVLAKLSKLNLKDLEITHASLEEVFMEFYI
ncbi:hypothetical protein COT70_00535 [candidate division WWE3 bacterium CG09_land_8_20_14_0_10_47_33]|uniref:ABC transporter domain-containing protein n=1 Tax=candidate division WWE3 bacterium CG_4_9_14_0_2_um_filter_48_10 TaxID=1975078 RepID=A0A2M8EI61_UNCKA|nr:MAG: hypothetical protein COT70_00535 [candidate division WWE3 bacterium CG09_land_8_20_14_0_10_47_33]PIZ40724.1 MAG: hypothetical protein COY35_01745 [candidate division WWE3 bacterium CG_4_10_14_0_2_um_filter_47_8]PJC22163.1 MAG: hypothetical protein CO059_02875 [candidate division WWE3 bacterium CG_4_9_14_0_2_um_filter_48_10]PJE52348.1 MAG: hypothetical protein COV28_00220 [candidate division WWE3 bacterium CG10_big_fil_rev_8_21_14_0_10_48_23]